MRFRLSLDAPDLACVDVGDNMNKNYQKGRNFEYRVMGYLRKLGYYCIRAYASKGLFDIIAVPNRGETLMIQAKYSGYVAPAELSRLRLHDKWAGRPIIAYTVKHKLKFRSIHGVEVSI